jgi:type I restriction enzyme S subunit
MERAKYLISEYDWLGEIPKDWIVAPLNSVTNPISIKDHPTEDLLSLYRDYGVILKNSRDDNHNRAGSDLSKYKLVNQGDLVINKMKAWQGSVGISKYRGIISPAYIICKVRDDIDSKFLNYLLRCNYYKHQYGRLSYGVRTDQWDIRYDDFKKLPVLLPEPEEQTQIAVFLDYKLSKIDRFIRKKKQLIKLLNEQKAAIINQAVTKGLDQNVKEHKIENVWIDKLPENFSLEGFNKNVFLKHGFQFREEHFSKKGIKVVKITQLSTDGKLRLENASFVPENYQELFQNIIIQEGDILMALTGGTIGKIIRADIKDEILLQNYRVGNFYPLNEKLSKEFLYWQLKSEFIQSQMKFFVRETGQPNIGKGDFRKIQLIIPPEDEQNRIVKFIVSEAEVIEKIIYTIEKEIILTQEYKTALIAEAVTGKIDVSDFVVPETLEDESYEDIEEELSLAAEGEAEYPNEDIEE